MAVGVRLIIPSDVDEFSTSIGCIDHGTKYRVSEPGSPGTVDLRISAKAVDSYGTSAEVNSAIFEILHLQISNSEAFESSNTLVLPWAINTQYDCNGLSSYSIPPTGTAITEPDPDAGLNLVRVANWTLSDGVGPQEVHIRFVLWDDTNLVTFPAPPESFMSSIIVASSPPSIPGAVDFVGQTAEGFVGKETTVSFLPSEDNISGVRGVLVDLRLEGNSPEIESFSDVGSLILSELFSPDTTLVQEGIQALLTVHNSSSTSIGGELQFRGAISDVSPLNRFLSANFLPTVSGTAGLYFAFTNFDATNGGNSSPLFANLTATPGLINAVGGPWSDFVLLNFLSDGTCHLVTPTRDSVTGLLTGVTDVTLPGAIPSFDLTLGEAEVAYRENRVDAAEVVDPALSFAATPVLQDSSRTWGSPSPVMWQKFRVSAPGEINRIEVEINNGSDFSSLGWLNAVIVSSGPDGLPVVPDSPDSPDPTTNPLGVEVDGITSSSWVSCVWSEEDPLPTYDAGLARQWNETLSLASGNTLVPLARSGFTGTSAPSFAVVPGEDYWLGISCRSVTGTPGADISDWTLGTPQASWVRLDRPVLPWTPEVMNSARAVAVDAPVQWITEFGEAGTSSAIASIEVVSGASGSPADIEVLFSSRLQDISASAEVLVNWRSGGGNLVTRLGEVLDLAPAISPLTRGLIGFRGASGTSSVALSRAEFSNGSIIPSIDVGDIGVFRAIKTSGGNLEVLDKASWSNADISEGWGGLTGINGGMAVWQNAGNLVFSEEAVGVEGATVVAETHCPISTGSASCDASILGSLTAWKDAELLIGFLPAPSSVCVGDIVTVGADDPSDFLLFSFDREGNVSLSRPGSGGVVSSEVLFDGDYFSTSIPVPSWWTVPCDWSAGPISISLDNTVVDLTTIVVSYNSVILFSSDVVPFFRPESEDGFTIALGFRSKQIDASDLATLQVKNVSVDHVNRADPSVVVANVLTDNLSTVPPATTTDPGMTVLEGDISVLVGVVNAAEATVDDDHIIESSASSFVDGASGSVLLNAGLGDADEDPSFRSLQRWVGSEILVAPGEPLGDESDALKASFDFEMVLPEGSDSGIVAGVASWLPKNAAAVAGTQPFAAYSFVESDLSNNFKAHVIGAEGSPVDEEQNQGNDTWVGIAFGSDGSVEAIAANLVSGGDSPVPTSPATPITSFGPLPSSGRMGIIVKQTAAGIVGHPVLTLTVDSLATETIPRGNSVVVAWEAEGATSISATNIPGAEGLSGSLVLTPLENVTYSMAVTDGTNVTTETATVTVNQTPVGVFINANRTNVASGDPVIIWWGSENATEVDMANSHNIPGLTTGSLSGTETVNPTVSTTYVIAVQDGASPPNEATASVVVEIGPSPTDPPVIEYFTSSTSSVLLGNSATLSWTVSGASGITIFPGSVWGDNPSGTLSVTPGETVTYVIQATNSAGMSSQEVTVTVAGSFSASPNPIASGESSTLSWSLSADVTAIQLSWTEGSLNVTGETSVSTGALFASRTFTLTVTHSTWTETLTTSAIVADVPLVESFSASPAYIAEGGTSTLFYNVSGAASVVISQGATTLLTTAENVGVLPVSPAGIGATTYTVTSHNLYGDATPATCVVNTGTPPSITSFAASQTYLTPSSPNSTLSWVTSGTSAMATINGSGVASSGSSAKTPGVTTSYTLVVSSPYGPSATQSLTLYYGGLPSISAFTTSSGLFTAAPSQAVDLIWTISGIDIVSVTIQAGAGPLVDVTSLGRLTVTPASTVTYYMVATNGLGETATANRTITVGAAPTITYFRTVGSSHGPFAPGDPVDLEWSIAGAGTLTSTVGPGSIYTGTGTSCGTTAGTMDENFVLTVTSGYGDPAVATWGIVVGRPPTILSFTESASVVAAGGSVDLTWDIGELGDGSASLSVDGGTPSPVSATGTASSGVLALGLHTFVLSAENEYGSPSQTLYCVAGVAPYVSLSGDSPVGTYASGTSIVLDWSVSGSSSITLNGGSVSATGSASEVLTGSPGSNVTFSMVAVNEYGSETQTLTYTISSGGGYEFPILHVVVDGSDVDVGSVVAELS